MNVRSRRPRPGDTTHLIFPVGVVIILVLAGVAMLYRIGTLPHGFLDSEAANGLLAREASGHGAALLTSVGSRSPLLAALIALAGRPFGFDILSARLGAALAGMGTAAFTALWLRRVFGAVWGITGGLILAGSFWILLFSRIALSPIAGALAVSLLLWCLVEGLARGVRTDALLWYAGAGVAAGIGYMSDPTLRVLPILLLVVLISATHEHGIVIRHQEIVGLLLMILVGLIVAGPFIRHTFSAPSLLTFWSGTPGLPGSVVTTANQAVHNYGVALEKLGWPVPASLGLNLPDTPLLGPFILPWAVVGLAIALRHVRNRLIVTAFLCGLLLLVPAAAITPVHPGRLLTIFPLLVALPVAGMRFVYRQSPSRRYQFLVAGMIVVMLASNAAMSSWNYFNNWVDAPQTARAFAYSVSSSMNGLNKIPGTGTIYYSTYGYDNVEQYLQPDARSGPHQRINFDGAHMLPIPLEGAGYLVVPSDTPVAPPLLQIMDGTGVAELSNDRYSVYRVDQRARDQLPLSIPTTVFSDGTRFLGNQVVATSSDRLSVVLAWQLPGDGTAHTIRVRLRPVAGNGSTQIVDVTLPGNLLSQPYDLLRLVTLKAPASGSSADLSISLLNAKGTVLTADGLDTDNYLFLNRYTFSR